MSDQRRKSVIWNVCDVGQNTAVDGAQLAVLMDIRDELQTLNHLLGCQNFLDVPSLLRSIKRNTTKPREKK